MKRLKNVLLSSMALFLLPMLIGAQEPQVTLDFDNAETASQIVQKYVKALHDENVSEMNALLAPNAVVNGLGGGSVSDSLNVAQHKEYFTNSTSTYDHTITRDVYLPVKVNNNWNEGEWVLTWGLNTLTDKESGKEIPVSYHIASIVQNGKIVRMSYYYDMLNIMNLQGYTLMEPTK